MEEAVCVHIAGHVTRVAEWLGRWTCDQRVAGSTPGRRAFGCILGQVVHAHTHTHVPLSPSSINWYRRKLGR